MKRLSRILFLLILVSAAYLGWHFRIPIADLYHRFSAKGEPEKPAEIPDPIRYGKLINDLEIKRNNLSQQYARARTAQEISQVINESRKILNHDLPALMRCWLGTPWALNGTCQTPGSGKIACGYFVSTILRDAGFKIERYKLAQQPSQNIIATFLPRNEMHVRSEADYGRFVAEVIARGPGIRIVGLDRHVAFLVVQPDNSIRFIHSSGAAPYCVVDENQENASSLQNSKYRVTGDLTANDEVIHRWLLGEKWPTKL